MTVGGRRIAVVVGRCPVEEDASGADVLISLRRKPYVHRRAAAAEGLTSFRGKTVMQVNLAGGHGQRVMEGASWIRRPDGALAALAPRFEEDLITIDLDSPPSLAEPPATRPIERLWAAIRTGLRDFVLKNRFQDVVLGLSGGVDSSVVACLAADALGPERVTGLIMPTAFSQEAGQEGAASVAAGLGIRAYRLSIEKLRIECEDLLRPVFEGTERGTAEENIQARIRCLLLMAYANKRHAMLLATGNRSELAAGYCTLYGDLAGGLAPIGDVPKTVVWRLAEYVNQQRQVIPPFVIERAPSAELSPGQTDQDQLPPYETLDAILELYLDEKLPPERIIARGFDADMVRDVVALVRGADFKRRQAPPALRVYSDADPWPPVPLAGPVAPIEEFDDDG